MKEPMSGPAFNLSDELKAYCHNQFTAQNKLKISAREDLSATFWEMVFNQGSYDSHFQMLSAFYPQLTFPIQQDINTSIDYKNTVLKGLERPLNQLKLNEPDAITAKMHHCCAGKIPVITIPDEQDFYTLLQSLLYKNNPVSIPQSMGAAFISGINNWRRIHLLKQKWLEKNAMTTWKEEFAQNVLPHPALYKDQIILLSTKSYSNIPSEQLSMPKEDWYNRSLAIRLEHECSHLYTSKIYGSASNNLHDELIADYMGIAKAFGKYSAELMLRFMGLEDFPNYKAGARLENYIKGANLNEADFKILCSVIKNAILNIEMFDAQAGPVTSHEDEASRVEALCDTDLLHLAAEEGCALLTKNYNQIFQTKKRSELRGNSL